MKNNKGSLKVSLPFRYPGGKFYALKQLQPFWQAIEHDEYREPFVGGGAVFFSKPKAKFNWINDIDSELILTYRVLSNTKLRSQLIKMVHSEVASKKRWGEIRNLKPSNVLEKAFRYYYLNRTSFSGKLSSPAWGYRPKRSLPPERWQERILPCGIRLEKVKITNEDFSYVIKSPAIGKNVLMFIDPPYFNPPKRKHYRNGFQYEDHLRLHDLLRATKHHFFLTYDDVPEVKELYRWANIYKTNFFYRVDNSNIQNGKRRIGCELVITNYRLHKQLQMELDLGEKNSNIREMEYA